MTKCVYKKRIYADIIVSLSDSSQYCKLIEMFLLFKSQILEQGLMLPLLKIKESKNCGLNFPEVTLDLTVQRKILSLSAKFFDNEIEWKKKDFDNFFCQNKTKYG